MLKIINVAGARPNFMKIAPLMDAFARVPDIAPILVHTGQHYDQRMSELFFRELGIPEPDINLGIGSGSHAVQTAAVMSAFEPVLLEHRPDAVLVVGDVNSTIACGLTAVKLGIKLIHVEAGLRSFDRSMPEEINRVLTDAISDFLFCTEQSGVDNLRREGVPEKRIFLVGNVMADTLLKNRPRAERSVVLKKLGLEPRTYAVLTLHRPSNVDDREVLAGILDAFEQIQRELPIIFPIHPRTRKNFSAFGFEERLARMPDFRMISPVGYLDFLRLTSAAAMILTDSGGIQEEATILKVPCLTLRENTERPVTVEAGGNRIVGVDSDRIVAAYRDAVEGRCGEAQSVPLWDGCAAERIVGVLIERL